MRRLALWPWRFVRALAGLLGQVVPGLCPGRQSLGRRGEVAAAEFLRQQGYTILKHSDRSKPGELDLVAWDGATVVFAEVKTRQHSTRGHPAEAVDPAKQRRLTRLAAMFLKRHGLTDRPARFDVIAVTWPEGQARPQIEHIPDAFEAAGQDRQYG